MAKYWIKLYIEILDDPKMGRLPDRLYRRVIELLLLAGEIDDGGYLPDVVDMAWRLRADDDFQNDMTAIEETGIITFSPERQRYCVTQFAKRQAASTEAERKAYQRQRDRKQNPIVTKCDAIVTGAGQNFVRYTDTDTDTDINYEDRGALPTERVASEVHGDTDTFDDMKNAIEALTGYMITPAPKEVEAINAMIAEGITSDDLNAAVAFHRDKGLVARGAAALLKSARYNKAQRTQATVKANGSSRKAGYNADVFEQVRQEMANGK